GARPARAADGAAGPGTRSAIDRSHEQRTRASFVDPGWNGGAADGGVLGSGTDRHRRRRPRWWRVRGRDGGRAPARVPPGPPPPRLGLARALLAIGAMSNGPGLRSWTLAGTVALLMAACSGQAPIGTDGGGRGGGGSGGGTGGEPGGGSGGNGAGGSGGT